MDGGGVGSSRKRPRVTASPCQESHDGESAQLTAEAAPTEHDPTPRRSRSAVKRERSRAAVSGIRAAQEDPQKGGTVGTSNGSRSILHALPDRKDVGAGGEQGKQDGLTPPKKSPGKGSRRGRRYGHATGDNAQAAPASVSSLVPAADVSVTSDPISMKVAATTALLSSLGGARAAMRARDLEATAAAAVEEAEARAISISKAKEEEEASKRAQQQALVAAQSALDQLRNDFERLKEESRVKDQLIQSQSSALSYLHGQASCAICLELAFRPHVLSPCGHTFCARCLIDWFQRPTDGEEVVDIHQIYTASQRREAEISATKRRKKICPHCRGDVCAIPAEVWSIKGMVDRLDFCQRLGYAVVEGDSTLPHLTALEERHLKGLDLPTGSALWEDIFDDRPMHEPIYDAAEGIFRCGRCTGEIVGQECYSCGAIYSDLEGLAEEFEDGSLDGRTEDSDESHVETQDTHLPTPTLRLADYINEDEDEDSMGSFIDDGDLDEEAAISEEDDERYANNNEAITRTGRRRYGYSSDEGGARAESAELSGLSVDADDHTVAELLPRVGSRGSHHHPRFGQSLRQGADAPMPRQRQRAIVVSDSDDGDEQSSTINIPATAARRRRITVISNNDSDTSNQEGDIDVEDADAADRWLSYSEAAFVSESSPLYANDRLASHAPTSGGSSRRRRTGRAVHSDHEDGGLEAERETERETLYEAPFYEREVSEESQHEDSDGAETGQSSSDEGADEDSFSEDEYEEESE